MTIPRRSQLHEPLREELARRFADAGWVVDVAYDTGPDGFYISEADYR